MAGLFLFANNANTTLAGPISSSAPTLTVASGTGALFPSPAAGQQFSLTLNDAATGLLYEICYVTSISGDTMTVLRAQEGTSARSWLAGDIAANLFTAGQAGAMVQQVSINPSRIITTSGAFTLTTSDANGYVGLNRTSSPSTSSTTLPSGATASQTYRIQDLAGNFAQFPVSVNAPGGMSIGGLAQVTGNINRQTLAFTYYGSNVWAVAGLV